VDESIASILKRFLEARGLQVICDNSIAEVLGDAGVKAVRLKTGKVMAAQMVVFSDAKADLQILSESGLDFKEGLEVNDTLQTNMKEVYAMDDVASFTKESLRLPYPLSLAELEEQGRVVAEHLQGREGVFFVPPLRGIRMTIGAIPVVLTGETLPQEGVEEFFESDEASQIYKKSFVKDHIQCGCVLINAPKRESLLVTSEFQKRNSDSPLFSYENKARGQDRPATGR
jgi:nitrite reductase (NADH) large subunit